MEEARRELSSVMTHTNSKCLKGESKGLKFPLNVLCVTCISCCCLLGGLGNI